MNEPCWVSDDELDARRHGHFCRVCRTNVHDLSAMSEHAASALLELNRERSLCVSYRVDLEGNLVHRKRITHGQISRSASLLGATAVAAGCALPATSEHAPEGARPSAAVELGSRDTVLDLAAGGSSVNALRPERAATEVPAVLTEAAERTPFRAAQPKAYLVRGRYTPQPIDGNPRVPDEGELPRPPRPEAPKPEPPKKESQERDFRLG